MTNRRDFLWQSGGGLGGVALSSLLGGEARGGGVLQEAHHRPKAKRVIQLFMAGAASHLDLFDYKPELVKRHGEKSDFGEHVEAFQNGLGPWKKPVWDFAPHGACGKLLGETVSPLGEVVDEMAFIHNMTGRTGVHSQATYLQATGFDRPGFPGMGSWVSYGLGNMTDNLPTYVVLPDARGMPAGSTSNWTNGFLPAVHQGVPFRTSGEGDAISNLFPARPITAEVEINSRALLDKMNSLHMEERGFEDVFAARVSSYELAAKMQLAVPEVTDISKESEAIRESYGLNGKETKDFGTSCLLARRMLEQGVRHVQLFSGGSFGSPRINWDGHEDMKRNHGREALRIDQPVAALLKDLRQRGMLDDTLVLFTSEFGRTPFTQSGADQVGTGRDHNQVGFSCWMAGAGLKHGITYGATDDVGYKSVVDPVPWYDFHATVLHLLGINHEELTYYHNGIQRRLTDVHGKLIDGILA